MKLASWFLSPKSSCCANREIKNTGSGSVSDESGCGDATDDGQWDAESFGQLHERGAQREHVHINHVREVHQQICAALVRPFEEFVVIDVNNAAVIMYCGKHDLSATRADRYRQEAATCIVLRPCMHHGQFRILISMTNRIADMEGWDLNQQHRTTDVS